MATSTEAQRESDTVLCSLARLLERTGLYDAFMADQTPAERETYWASLTDARERLAQ
jgi:hypothetical protein